MNCTLPEEWCNPFVLSSVMSWVDDCTESCSGSSPSVMGTLFCCIVSAYLLKKVRKNLSFIVHLQVGNKTYRKLLRDINATRELRFPELFHSSERICAMCVMFRLTYRVRESLMELKVFWNLYALLV